ncbi:MAG: amino acid-binding protein [Sulfurovum sp.]|nr:amino acid-binding protein [Sulfurovum sp.]
MSKIKQLSIFMENKKGELSDVMTLLSQNNVSIKSINLVDSADFGILKLIVDDEQKTKHILDDAGFSVKITDVFAVAIDDHVGSFHEVVSVLSQNDINIEYTYTVNNGQNGAFVFKVDAGDFQKATEALSKAGVQLLQKI